MAEIQDAIKIGESRLLLFFFFKLKNYFFQNLMYLPNVITEYSLQIAFNYIVSVALNFNMSACLIILMSHGTLKRKQKCCGVKILSRMMEVSWHYAFGVGIFIFFQSSKAVLLSYHLRKRLSLCQSLLETAAKRNVGWLNRRWHGDAIERAGKDWRCGPYPKTTLTIHTNKTK